MSTQSDVEQADGIELVEQAYLQRQGLQSADWLHQIELRQEPLMGMLQGCIDRGQALDAQQMAGALGWVWSATGKSAEGRRWLAKALAISSRPSAARARALYEAGLLAFREGDNASCKSLNEEGLVIARQLGDKHSVIMALVGLARAALRDLDLAAVRAAAQEGFALAEQLDDAKAKVLPLHLLAELTRLEGDYDRAAVLYDQSLALNRELGNQGMVAVEHHNKAYVALHQRDFAQATALLKESLRLEQALGRQTNMAFCLAGFAAVAVAQGQFMRGAQLFGTAASQFKRLAVILDPTDQPEFDRNLAAARAGLGDAAFDQAHAEGSAMDFDQAIGLALTP